MFDLNYTEIEVKQKVVVQYKDGDIYTYLPENIEKIFLNTREVASVAFMKGGGIDE